MDAARDGRPPPDNEWLVFNWCQLFGCLPSELLDEDYGLIMRMLQIDNTYQAVRAISRAKGAQIHDVPQAYLRIIDYLIKEGLYGGLS